MTFSLPSAAEQLNDEAPARSRRFIRLHRGDRMSICCPKCASSEGRRIEAIYAECKTPTDEHDPVNAELSRQSAPPVRKHPIYWVAFASVLSIAALASFTWRESVAVTLLLSTGLVVLKARDADRYNQFELPRLLDYWHHAVICGCCGEVFVPAETANSAETP